MAKVILAGRTDPDVPITKLVNLNGGVTGLTMVIRIFNGADLSQFLDFADGVFKDGGHATPTLTLPPTSAADAPGVYAVDGGFDLSAITIPAAASYLLVRYEITAGGEFGDDTDTIQFTDMVQDAAQAALTAQGYTAARALLIDQLDVATAGGVAEYVTLIRKIAQNRISTQGFGTPTTTQIVYDDDGTTPLITATLTTDAGGDVLTRPGIQVNRTAFS